MENVVIYPVVGVLIILAICPVKYVFRKVSQKKFLGLNLGVLKQRSRLKPIVSEEQVEGMTKYVLKNVYPLFAQGEVFNKLWNVTIVLNEKHCMNFYILQRKENKLTLIGNGGELIGCLDGDDISFAMLPEMKHTILGNMPLPSNVEFFTNEDAHIYVIKEYNRGSIMYYKCLVSPCGVPTY